MKKALLLLVVCFLMTGIILRAQENSKEQELIKEVIQNAYVDGLCNNADAEAVRKGFHPGFELLGIGYGNTMRKTPIYNWIEDAKNGKKSGRKYSFQNELTTVKFLFVDFEGKAAVAKIEFYEGNDKKYIDYLSLYKFEDGWKIISKIYHPLPQVKKN